MKVELKFQLDLSVREHLELYELIGGIFNSNGTSSVSEDAPHSLPLDAKITEQKEKPKRKKKEPSPSVTEPKTDHSVTEPKTDHSSVNIVQLRALLAKCVSEHREEIKAKLTELDAESVSTLNPDKYDEMYNFLSNL